MPSSKETRCRNGSTADDNLTIDQEISFTSLECPRTPENREAPQVNLGPGPKAVSGKSTEQTSPTPSGRSRRPCNNSGYATHVAVDPLQIEAKATASKTNIGAREPPKTPTRANALFREDNGCRTASPKKCPSVNRSRLQSKYYRLRSPLARRTAGGLPVAPEAPQASP